MKDFFRSRLFKGIAVLAALLFAFFLHGIRSGELMPAMTDFGGALMAPVSRFFSGLGTAVGDWIRPVFRGRSLQEENENLRAEIDRLNRKIAEYDAYRSEIELYRDFLEFGSRETDFTLKAATVIARPADARYEDFTIDAGSCHGVEPGMPVVTASGLVGIVGETAHSYSKVQTIIDPAVRIGVLDSSTRDTAVLRGEAPLAGRKRAAVNLVSKESAMAPGDLVVTSGYGGMIPRGLVVGEIETVGPDPTGLALTAVLRPAVDFHAARTVFVITDYAEKPAGRGSGNPE